MRNRIQLLLAPALISLALVVSLAGCKEETSLGAFTCINDMDCPASCTCVGDELGEVAICQTLGIVRVPCGGTCISDEQCPEGTECKADRSDENVAVYACVGSGTAGLGDDCQSDATCDPNASPLGVFCCLDAEKCGANVDQCVEDCSTYSSGGDVGMMEGTLCEDNSECGTGLFCCLVPNAAGNCDFGQDQSCTCRNLP